MELLLLAGLYCGLPFLSLLVVLAGYLTSISRRTAAIACAIAGSLLLLHSTVLYFLTEMSTAWGGDADVLPLQAGYATSCISAAATLTLLFRRFKRPRDPARDESSTIVRRPMLGLILLLAAAGTHLLTSFSSAVSLTTTSPQDLFVRSWWVAMAVPAAIALFSRQRLAWWCAMTCTSIQLFRLGVWLIAAPPGIGISIISLPGLQGLILLIVAGALFANREHYGIAAVSTQQRSTSVSNSQGTGARRSR